MELRLIERVLFSSEYCKSCPAARDCQARDTPLGCSELGPPHPAVLHFTGPDWLERYAEVNTFDFNVTARPGNLPLLPSYIPILRPDNSLSKPSALRSTAIAIPLGAVLPLAGRVRRTGKTLKQLLGLTDDQLVIVLGFAHDRFLEAQWPESRRARLLTAILGLQPDLTVAWNYSVWHRHAAGWVYPRADQLYNLNRSLKIYAEMQAIGLPAIPHIYWGVPDDIDRWATWLYENPAVTMASIDLQTLDSPKSWERALQYLSQLRIALGSRRLRILFSGICSAARVVTLKQTWPESSLANFGAYFGSTKLRYKKCYGLERPWLRNPETWTRYDVLNEIVRQYTHLFTAAESETVVRSSVA